MLDLGGALSSAILTSIAVEISISRVSPSAETMEAEYMAQFIENGAHYMATIERSSKEHTSLQKCATSRSAVSTSTATP